MSPYGEPVTAHLRQPRPRRRRWLAPLWVSILGLGLVLAVADRAAASIVTNQLEAQIVAGLTAHDIEFDAATVNIAGYPFLNQVAQGRYDEITIELDNVRSTQTRDIALPHLQVVATGVSADAVELVQGTAVVIADRLSGTAVVSFPTVAVLLGDSLVGVSGARFFDVDGTLHATGSATVNGVSVRVTAAVELTVVHGALEVRLRQPSVADVDAPDVVKKYLADLEASTFRPRLPTLPFSLTLDQVSSQPAGLAIAASAQAVPLVG